MSRHGSTPRTVLFATVCLVLVVCGQAGPGQENRALSPEEASARVSELLYSRNLITDPEVSRKMNEYVLAMSRDGVPSDSVMPDAARWLDAWARAHPDRVAAARLASGPRSTRDDASSGEDRPSR